MPTETLKALASEIVAQTIAENWAFWAVLACLTVLLSASGAFLGGYVKKRAEQAALEADFDAVKKQLHETTALTESIKTDIKHLAERSEKLRWLKQEKLEAYVVSILGVVDYYSAEMYHQFFDSEQPTGGDPWKTAKMLQTLYLPELAVAHAALSGALGEFQGWVGEGMQQRLDILTKTGQKQTPSDAHRGKFTEHLSKINAAVLAIQAAAQKLAGELTKV
jgi:hypothetical protein